MAIRLMVGRVALVHKIEVRALDRQPNSRGGSLLIAEFQIIGLPPMVNVNQAKGWRGRHFTAKRWSGLVADHCYLLKIADLKLKKAMLTFTRLSSKEPDSDGLISGFKYVQDGLVKAQVIIDDKPSVIGMPNYIWRLTSPKTGAIIIRIETD